jgi:hypothetical protein
MDHGPQTRKQCNKEGREKPTKFMLFALIPTEPRAKTTKEDEKLVWPEQGQDK